jgi:hypothetical protein
MARDFLLLLLIFPASSTAVLVGITLMKLHNPLVLLATPQKSRRERPSHTACVAAATRPEGNSPQGMTKEIYVTVCVK